jgi:hypothetical protein
MLINNCFGFMMFIASLIESLIAKTVDVAETQDPVSEFRPDHFARYLVSLGPAFGLPAHRNE